MNFDKPQVPTQEMSDETPEEKAARMAGDLELVPLEEEQEAVIETPAEVTPAEQIKQETARLAEETVASEAADAAKAEALLVQIKGGEISSESGQEDIKSFVEAQKLLESLHAGANSAIGAIDMGMGRIAPAAGEKINTLKALLPKVDQGKLAEEFWGSTCAQLKGNKEAYQVYLSLKGSEFSRRFKELESARLEEAGYGKFVL